MARSWVGRTIFACWPCMAMLRLREARHSYMNCENTEECYECAVVSSKILSHTRLLSALSHKGELYSKSLKDTASAVYLSSTMINSSSAGSTHVVLSRVTTPRPPSGKSPRRRSHADQ